MADVAGAEGYQETDEVEDADLVVLNTCHIRERASEKIYSELGKVRETQGGARERRAATRRWSSPAASPRPRAAKSCAASRRSTSSSGRRTITACRDCCVSAPSGARRRRHRISARGQVRPSAAAPRRRRSARAASTAFVTVQEGCDKFCSFCVVPYTRGARGLAAGRAECSTEIARLAAAGVREVTLIGQNVNAYHGRDAERPRDRSRRAARRRGRALPGVLRLRYATSHPNDMSDSADRAPIATSPRSRPICICRCRSGSDRILAAMNRRHTRRRLSRHRRAGRAARGPTSRSPRISSSAFPARATPISRRRSTLVREVGFASAYAFKYSPRPGTPAAELERSGRRRASRRRGSPSC